MLDPGKPHVTAVIDRYLPAGTQGATIDMDGFVQCVADVAGAVKKFEHDRRYAKFNWLCSFMPIWRGHEKAHRVYTNNWVQLVVAFVILANFVVNCVEKEVDPFPADLQLHGKLWGDFDTAFNIIFLFEIILNIWGSGGPYKKFWRSGWNVFDFIVVAAGLILMTGAVPPDSPLANLKMLRAFRVFRLFKRIESLNKVISALMRAIPGVTNAFVIMVRAFYWTEADTRALSHTLTPALASPPLAPHPRTSSLNESLKRPSDRWILYYARLSMPWPYMYSCKKPHPPTTPRSPPQLIFMMIYAILAVEYFAQLGQPFGATPYGTYFTYDEFGNHSITAETARGLIYGYEYYGSFTKALYTLFQASPLIDPPPKPSICLEPS